MKSRSTILLAVVALLAGCSSIEVVTKHAPDVDFKQYKTYCWAESPAESDRSRDLVRADRRVRELVDRALAGKGFTRRDAAPADLVVSRELTAKRERLLETDVSRWPSGTFDLLNTEVTQGKLVLSFVDPRREKTVWRSEASDVIDQTREGTGELEPVGGGLRQLDAAVARMMAAFPPDRD